MAVAGTDRQIAILKTRPSFSMLKKFSAHSDVVTALNFGMDTKLLVSGSVDKTVRIWDIN